MNSSSSTLVEVCIVLLFKHIWLINIAPVLPRPQQDFLSGHKAHLTHKSMDPIERRQPRSQGSFNSTDKAGMNA